MLPSLREREHFAFSANSDKIGNVAEVEENECAMRTLIPKVKNHLFKFHRVKFSVEFFDCALDFRDGSHERWRVGAQFRSKSIFSLRHIINEYTN